MTPVPRLRSRSSASAGSSGSLSLKRSVKNFMGKIVRTVKNVAHEALNDSDTECEQITVNNMFLEPECVGNPLHADDEDANHDNRLSSNSETLADGFSTENNVETSGEGEENSQDFLSFDPVQEVAKLRQEDQLKKADSVDTFSRGPEVWEKRRKLWLTVTPSNTLESAKKARESFADISPKKYGVIYKRLVMEDAHLKKNLNLQDVVKVINAGWVETSKWERAAQGLA